MYRERFPAHFEGNAKIETISKILLHCAIEGWQGDDDVKKESKKIYGKTKQMIKRWKDNKAAEGGYLDQDPRLLFSKISIFRKSQNSSRCAFVVAAIDANE